MKFKELKEFVKRSHTPRHDDSDVSIHIHKPSMGPIAMVKVKSIRHGFDWESGYVILDAEEKIVRKSENEAIYDMSYDLLSFLHKEGLQKKRKPWWFRDIERIYDHLGILERMRKFNSK